LRRCVRCGGSDSTKKSRRVKVTTTEIFDLLLFTLILGGVIWLGYRTMRLRPPDGERGTGADFSWMCRPTSVIGSKADMARTYQYVR
jgi:hypothetical protein